MVLCTLTHGFFGNLVYMYSLVFANTQWCAVNEAYTRAFAQQDFLDKRG